MTTAPTVARRRGPAAASGRTSRRPLAARPWARLVAAAALAALAGCAASSSTPPAGNVFTARQQVSRQQVEQAIYALYRSHPGISSFSVQDVQYTAESRGAVLRECTSTAAGTKAQTTESSQIVACAPLIFFLYSYGRRASVPAAVGLAGELYWYAVTHITGTFSAKTSLDELLRSWKLPVPGLTAAEAKKAILASVVDAADNSILAQKSVHIVITGRRPGSTAVAERIVADIGTATGAETINSGSASAAIRVTPNAAYFTGNRAGLITLIRLSNSAAAKAGSRWVAIKAGTTEYQDLATEDTIASLPASILPASRNTAQLRTATMAGRKVYVLDWAVPASGSSGAASERLILAATTRMLPLMETTTTDGETQTVTLGRWGERLTIPVPASSTPYSSVVP